MGIPYGTANGRPLLFLSRDFNHSWLTTLAGQTDHQNAGNRFISTPTNPNGHRTPRGHTFTRAKLSNRPLVPGGVTGVNGRLRNNFDCRKVAYGCPLDGTLLRSYLGSRTETLRAMAREG